MTEAVSFCSWIQLRHVFRQAEWKRRRAVPWVAGAARLEPFSSDFHHDTEHSMEQGASASFVDDVAPMQPAATRPNEIHFKKGMARVLFYDRCSVGALI